MKLRLRELREAQGLKVAQMCARLDVKDSRYRKWESEAAQIPINYAMMCCDILHCTLDELAGRRPMQVADDERKLLTLYRATDDRGRDAIMAVAASQVGMERQSDFGNGSSAVTV